MVLNSLAANTARFDSQWCKDTQNPKSRCHPAPLRFRKTVRTKNKGVSVPRSQLFTAWSSGGKKDRKLSQGSRILQSLEGSDPRAADELLPLVNEELRKLAAYRSPFRLRARPCKRLPSLRPTCVWFDCDELGGPSPAFPFERSPFVY